MSIESLIFHRLQRWDEEKPAVLQLASAATTPTADHQALFTQLKKVFQFKVGKQFGQFSQDAAEHPLRPWLKDYRAGRIDLYRLSCLFSEHFKGLIDTTSEAFEAVLLTLLEGRADGARIYLFALHSNSGLYLDSRLELDTVDYLNLNTLDFALRIDLPEWQGAEDNPDQQHAPYLCLLRARSPAKISEAFACACAFQNSVDTDKETEVLMDMLARYTHQSDNREAGLVRKKAYDFCVEQQKLGEPVPLNELSCYLDENAPARFAQFAAEQAHLPGTHTMRPDTRKLKHLVRFSGKGHGLSLSFSSDLIQQTILYDEKSDTLTITSIPRTLKEQLMQHLQEAREDDCNPNPSTPAQCG
jgi:nucleoid-associated protein